MAVATTQFQKESSYHAWKGRSFDSSPMKVFLSFIRVENGRRKELGVSIAQQEWSHTYWPNRWLPCPSVADFSVAALQAEVWLARVAGKGRCEKCILSCPLLVSLVDREGGTWGPGPPPENASTSALTIETMQRAPSPMVPALNPPLACTQINTYVNEKLKLIHPRAINLLKMVRGTTWSLCCCYRAFIGERCMAILTGSVIY